MQYSSEVRAWRDRIGRLEWAACQDWMCEPFILEKTRCSLRFHQQATIANYLLLRQLAPDLPWVPVIQGWEWDEYLAHVEAYRAEGIRLEELPIVGLGSVCRRQDTDMVEALIRHLAGRGIRLHGFGFKVLGLRRSSPWLVSADSMAWSLAARREVPLPGHTHKSCANCLTYALEWRARLLRGIAHPVTQYELFL